MEQQNRRITLCLDRVKVQKTFWRVEKGPEEEEEGEGGAALVNTANPGQGWNSGIKILISYVHAHCIMLLSCVCHSTFTLEKSNFVQ